MAIQIEKLKESSLQFTDITTANATTSLHGLLPKLGGGTTNFLRADGSWSAPTGGSGVWTTVVKTSDQGNNTTTLADDTVLQFTTLANTQYVIRLRVRIITNATADSKYRLVHGGTTTRVSRKICRTATTDIAMTIELKTAFDSADVILSTTGLNPWVEEDIVLNVGASGGILKFQFAENTANATGPSVLEGSYIEYATS